MSEAPPQSWAFSCEAKEVRGIRRGLVLPTQGPACTVWLDRQTKNLGDGQAPKKRGNLPFFKLLGTVKTACLVFGTFSS